MTLLDQCLELEAQWTTLTESERWAKLETIGLMLKEFTHHAEPEYQKLSQLTRCLQQGMSLRDFYSVLVPVERVERRKTTDAHFLVTSEDRKMAPASQEEGLVVVLDNIRSAFNVGSIARIADCVGAKAIYTCGYTAESTHPQVAKSALGAESSLEWKSFVRVDEAIHELKVEGYSVFALETAQSKSLYSTQLPTKSAFIFGNERFGLDETTLGLCDGVLQIPTFGVKNSLNVAASFALTAYEWKKQREPELFL